MADRISQEKRSNVMSKVRSRGTKLEKSFAQQLSERRLDMFVEQPKGIPGKPDFAIEEARIAIFVDSCYWHGCPKHLRMPASNTDYWERKIARNKRRDKEINRELRNSGWHVVRFWEHELPTSPSLKGKLTRLIKYMVIQGLIEERSQEGQKTVERLGSRK